MARRRSSKPPPFVTFSSGSVVNRRRHHRSGKRKSKHCKKGRGKQKGGIAPLAMALGNALVPVAANAANRLLDKIF